MVAISDGSGTRSPVSIESEPSFYRGGSRWHIFLLWLHNWIIPITWLLVVADLIVAIWWIICPTVDRLEPVATTIGLLAAIAGLLIDRWLSEREKKESILRSLLAEVRLNKGLIDPELLKVSPTDPMAYRGFVRPLTVNLEMALASGVFTQKPDMEIYSHILSALFATTSLRDEFLAFEMRMLVGDPSDYQNIRNYVADGAKVRDTKNRTDSLHDCLVAYYRQHYGEPPDYRASIKSGSPPD